MYELIIASAVCFLVGILCGSFIKTRSSYSAIIGTFTINKTDPQKELFEIRFEKDLGYFENKKYILFKMQTK